MMTWELQLAIEGRLGKELEQARTDFRQALRGSLAAIGKAAQEELRADVRRSGLKGANRLANTWRMTLYPEAGREAYDGAAYLYSRAPVIQRAFEQGALIRSREGFFLAIPTEFAPRADIGRPSRRNLVRAAEARFGRLRFVYRRNGPSLLVAEARINARGRAVAPSLRARRTGNGLATVVVFLLVPQARLRRRLAGAALRSRIERRFPARLQFELDRRLEQADARRQARTFR